MCEFGTGSSYGHSWRCHVTTEPQNPETELATAAATVAIVGRETVALARRHSEITKRLTRKLTVRRIAALKALVAKDSTEEAAV